MIRLCVVVEGRTEESFVTHTLCPHLAGREIFARPVLVTTKRDRITGRKTGKGGGRWKDWRKDLARLLLDRSSDVCLTTLFDLYGLPDDFPKPSTDVNCVDTLRRVELLEHAMAGDIGDPRLIPYIQRHEFEALVLAALPELRSLLDAPDDLAGLDELRGEIAGSGPEDVDDGVKTAPSKRLVRHIPSYQKTLHGPLAVEALGLPRLRAACPRFDAWVERLERLPHANP